MPSRARDLVEHATRELELDPTDQLAGAGPLAVHVQVLELTPYGDWRARLVGGVVIEPEHHAEGTTLAGLERRVQAAYPELMAHPDVPRG